VTSPLLELVALDARYGPVQALRGLSLVVPEGSMLALLGANGAGKTTTLRAVSGTVRTSGRVLLDGRVLRGRTPDSVARLGVAHVPEGRGILGDLTVRENLRLGGFARGRRARRDDLARVYAHFPRLAQRERQLAGTLSGGEQQMLALARALLSRPRLLMLDEPSLGLAPLVVREIFALLAKLNAEEGLTVLLVEQNASLALAVCDRACVLEAGRVAVAGASEALRLDDAVRRSYLGY
jgi:branched-chain amino acid transport system ATP-binding protein